MKKYNLHLLKVDDVRTICIHNENCRTCPLSDKEGFCPFMNVSPNNWRLD